MPEITITISMGSEGVSVTRDPIESDESTFIAPPQDVSEESTEAIAGEDFSIPPVPEEESFEEDFSAPPPPEIEESGESPEFFVPPPPDSENGG
ncbi:MAG TPA: hypothetical protein EYG88_12840 [Desulfocapsa sulfexigens]|nr:hypothetical protein [Desulfocapsa sulfexigens]